MMSNKGNAEELLQCPYDKSHQILKHKMQTHLVKCQRNHPTVRIATCTFNATHRVQEPELKHHLSICPDRLLLDKFTYKAENVQGADVLYPIPKLDLEPSECWDNDEPVPAYNPEEQSRNKAVLRNNIHTQSSAKRRNFRIEERARMRQFDNDTTKVKPQPLGLEVTQKQRRPAGKSAGILNEHDKLDICDIMEELTLNAGVLTTPKVPSMPPQKPREMSQPAVLNNVCNDEFDKNYATPADDFSNSQPKSAPWSAATLAMDGIALNDGSKLRSRGRGSFLAKKD